MRKQLLVGALALVLLAGLCGVGWNPATAEERLERKPPPSPDLWIYDVRIVRVDPPTPEGAEKPGPFAYLSGTTIQTTWPEALAALKTRGPTTLLMDQRVTALEGHEAEAKTQRSIPLLVAQFEDINNRQRRAARLLTGCGASMTTTQASFSYDLDVKWALHDPVKDEGAPEATTQWTGSHPTLSGDTLVLHSREQISAGAGKGLRAIEIYALITGRKRAKK